MQNNSLEKLPCCLCVTEIQTTNTNTQRLSRPGKELDGSKLGEGALRARSSVRDEERVGLAHGGLSHHLPIMQSNVYAGALTVGALDFVEM